MRQLSERIAELLAQGQVVANFDGRMEYGPRALGNRSILYQTTDRSVNDWLNKRLKQQMRPLRLTLWQSLPISAIESGRCSVEAGGYIGCCA